MATVHAVGAIGDVMGATMSAIGVMVHVMVATMHAVVVTVPVRVVLAVDTAGHAMGATVAMAWSEGMIARL
jgi:hypothetical protein